MNPYDAITEAQRRLLRSSAWQILAIAIFQTCIIQLENKSVGWIALSLVMGLISIPPLVSGSELRKLSLAFVAPLSIFTLIAPWMLGGVRHPITLLPIVALHTAAFLLGARVALWAAGVFLANTVLLAVFESRNLIESTAPSIETTLLYLAVFSIHALLFMSHPLDVIRQFLIHAASDLVARKENENDLVHMTDELEGNVQKRVQELTERRAQLHESVEDFAASMKQSIADLLDASRELAETFPHDSGEPRWMAYRIASGCERMETMHTSLHRFCMLGEAALSPRGLSPEAHMGMIHRIWSEIRSLHPDRIVSFFLDPIPGCNCDPDLLRQVWQNLLSNAEKYTVGTPSACVKVYFRNGEFCVEDNGAGFDMAFAEKLFGVFQRLHPEKEFDGEGIGLAMARRIVELHGGGIRAEAKSGQGAIFRFHLPNPTE